MFKFFLVTSLLGTIANLVQAPWNFFFLFFLIFPILHIILDKIIRDQKYQKRFISVFILLGGFLYFYFLFGFSWIINAFEYKSELSSFKYITLFGLPFLMLIDICKKYQGYLNPVPVPRQWGPLKICLDSPYVYVWDLVDPMFGCCQISKKLWLRIKSKTF